MTITNSNIWQPESVWDIDLFNNPISTISALQTNSSHVICYFSAASYEDWRPDASNFTNSDLGSDLFGWPGEKWLNLSSSNARSIMTRRLDLAVTNGCDGVDPDNIDGYSNVNGLGLTQQDSIDYMNFLADEAAARNLSIGLKNAGEIIPSVIERMQWSVNEQCHQNNECGLYSSFVENGKPVLNVEYPKGDETNNNNPVTASQLQDACNNSGTAREFSTIVKNMNLDWWIESCNGTVVAVASDGSSSDGVSVRISISFSFKTAVLWFLLLVGITT